jgi:hypothetical protein
VKGPSATLTARLASMANVLEVDAAAAAVDWEAEEAAEVAGVDEGLSSADVVGRIEELVAEMVQVSHVIHMHACLACLLF